MGRRREARFRAGRCIIAGLRTPWPEGSVPTAVAVPSEPEEPLEPIPEGFPAEDDGHPAACVRQVVTGLVASLTAHGHAWTPQQKAMVARALGVLQRWEDEVDDA